MKWRGRIGLALVVGMLLTAGQAWGAEIYYDGRMLSDEQTAVIEERLLAPLDLWEATGEMVVYFEVSSQTAVVLGGTPEWVTALAVPVGSAQAYRMAGSVADFEAIGMCADNIDWSRVETFHLEAPAELTEGRVWVPLRGIAEALGYGVSWDGALERVTITPPASPETWESGDLPDE